MSEDNDTPDDPYDGLDPENLPEGCSMMSVSADEIAYLQAYWEIRSHGLLLGWAARLLYDLTKADEAGWCLLLQKAELDVENKAVIPDVAYKTAAFRLEWLMPGADGTYARLPIDRLEEQLKRKPDTGEGI